MATAAQKKRYEDFWVDSRREGRMSDLPKAEQREITRRSKRTQRSNQIQKAKAGAATFFDRYTAELVLGAAIAVGGFFWIRHQKRTTGSIW